MSVEDKVAIARRFIAEQDTGKGPPPEELCAAGYTTHILSFPPMELAGLAKVFHAAFPDLKQTIEDVLANEEMGLLVKARPPRADEPKPRAPQ